MQKLFKDCKLPENDERAMGILQRIAEMWEDNSWIEPVSIKGTPVSNSSCTARTYHEKIPVEIQEALITLTQTIPQELEDMLNEEMSLHNIIQFARNSMCNE